MSASASLSYAKVRVSDVRFPKTGRKGQALGPYATLDLSDQSSGKRQDGARGLGIAAKNAGATVIVSS